MTQSKGQMAEMLFQAVHGVTGVSLTKILQASLNAVFLEISK